MMVAIASSPAEHAKLIEFGKRGRQELLEVMPTSTSRNAASLSLGGGFVDLFQLSNPALGSPLFRILALLKACQSSPSLPNTKFKNTYRPML